MKKNAECQSQCAQVGSNSMELKHEDAAILDQRIREEYNVRLIIDNLPCATRKLRDEKNAEFIDYQPGYQLGYVDNAGTHINNNLHFKLKYHTDDDEHYMLVGCEVIPKSVGYDVVHIDQTDSNICSIKTKI